MPFHHSKIFRRKIKQIKGVRQTFNRIKKDAKEIAKNPIETANKIAKEINVVEEIQQADIDKEIELVKKDIDLDVLNEDTIKAKINQLLNKLPKEEKIRKLIDENILEKNIKLASSKLSIKL